MNSRARARAISIAVLTGCTLSIVSCSDSSPSPSAWGVAEDPDVTYPSGDVPDKSLNADESTARTPSSDTRWNDCATDDFLYVGDNSDDAVERFDAKIGAFLGHFVQPGAGQLLSPRGIIFRKRHGSKDDLLLVDQNADVDNLTGEILRYSHADGSFLGALVAAATPGPPPAPPFAPRGMILKHKILYVADQGDDSPFVQGRLTRWDVDTGASLGDLSTEGLPFPVTDFHPRSVVIGPDGKLYVSSTLTTSITTPGGYVLRFDRHTGKFLNVVIQDNTNGCDLDRPEGLVFGPDGKLYVTSLLSAEDNDTDKILIVEVSHGQGVCLDSIELAPAGEPRAFAQALLFGPKGFLFVPTSTGAVRRYDVKTKTFDTFVSSVASPLGQPFYLTFGKTNPATLAYEP
jgi:hypothetical protein